MTEALEQKCVTALTATDATSLSVLALMAELNDAVVEADSAAREARAKALDPLRSPNLSKARGEAETAQLAHDRLQALQPRLQQRQQELQTAEEEARWRDQYLRVAALRDGAVERFREIEGLIEAIAERMYEAAEVDRQIDALNLRAPPMGKRLQSVELTARALENFSIDSPPLGRELKLPEWRVSCRLAYPRRFAPTIVAPPQPGANGDWAAHLKARGEAIRAEHERVADYYDRRQAEQEARQ